MSIFVISVSICFSICWCCNILLVSVAVLLVLLFVSMYDDIGKQIPVPTLVWNNTVRYQKQHTQHTDVHTGSEVQIKISYRGHNH